MVDISNAKAEEMKGLMEENAKMCAKEWRSRQHNSEDAEADSVREGGIKGSMRDRRLREFPVSSHPRYLSRCEYVASRNQCSPNVTQILETFRRAIELVEKSRSISSFRIYGYG